MTPGLILRRVVTFAVILLGLSAACSVIVYVVSAALGR